MRRPIPLSLFLATLLAIEVTTPFVPADEFPYQKPPKEVLDVLTALPTPTISVSPHHDYAIFMQPVRYPSINEVAQPMLRLAGIRIDSTTNGMHLAPGYTSLTIKRIADGGDSKIPLPPEPGSGAPAARSANSRRFSASALVNDQVQVLDLGLLSTYEGLSES